MIDIRLLRQDADATRTALARRLDPSLDATLAALQTLDQRRRELLARVESLKAARNTASEEVASRKKARQPADDLLAELKHSGEEVKQLDVQVREIETDLEARLLGVPNLPLPEAPDGDAAGNTLARAWGTPPKFDFTPKPHWELGAALGLFDLARGAKLTGSGFPVFTGMGARLIRSLKNFMLDLHTREHGYEEVAPPFLVSRATMTGTGQLPKFEEEPLPGGLGRPVPDSDGRSTGYQPDRERRRSLTP